MIAVCTLERVFALVTWSIHPMHQLHSLSALLTWLLLSSWWVHPPPQLPLLLLVRSTPCLLSNKFGCSLVSQTNKPSKAQKMKKKKKQQQQ